MQETKNNIFKQEEETLKKAKENLNTNKDDYKLLFKEYKSLTTAYEELLNNTKLLTTISDRFQEKYKLANDKLQQQADAINEMNIKLDADNRLLKSDLKKISRKNYFSQLSDYTFFQEEFQDKERCLVYLSELKWGEKFECKKCGNNKYCNGNTPFSRRCTTCRYDESVTAFTLLHKCKFPIEKALYMSLLVYYRAGKVSSYELSNILSIRQKTCWCFKQKTLEAVKKHAAGMDRTLDTWHKILLNH